MRALGLSAPRFAHVPLVLGPDGSRLSKRHGAIGVRAWRERGVTAERLVGLLAGSLGLCPPDATLPAAELVPAFDLARLTRDPTILDVDAL